MILAFVTILFLLIVLLFLVKERRGLKKNIEDTMSDDVKRELNFRMSTKSAFDEKMDPHKKRLSERVLEELNRD